MDSRGTFLFRIRFISFFAILAGVLIIVRLFSLQIMKSESYTEEADRLYVRSSDSLDRETIYFQKKDGGRISAAVMMNGYLLAVNPTQIKNPLEVYEKLVQVIPDLSKEDFLIKAGKTLDPYEEIYDKITREQADKISALKITGVNLYKHKWRFYPGHSMAAQTIGFLGYGYGDTLTGQYGLEKYYNETLEKNEEDLYVNIFAEIFFGVKNIIEGEVKEGDIVTTIEPTVQDFLEDELKVVQDKYDSESANGIIISPQTGEIYAMAHYPTFDLNKFSQVGNSDVYINPLVESVFEFGSVIKPLVMAAGIEDGVLSASTPFNDKGFVQIEDKTIYNFDKQGRGRVTMQDVLSQSLNTGMVYAMQLIGRQSFKKHMLDYRLGEKTNIDLPNEAKGLVSNLNEPRELEYANISFGQGISFSPVVLVRAFSSLGNGGYLVRPHLVKEIDYGDGFPKMYDFPKTEEPRVLSAETSSAISKMLVYSVDNVYGSGKYKMEHYTIAAKTGTAQIPDPAGGYYTDRNLHSFIGYFPAYDPQFLIFLSIRSPRGVRYAAETLSAPFFDITKFLINYYEIEPDR